MNSWERGSWMQTYTGKQFYPMAPLIEDIDPVDIAHALSLICRYGGHVNRFYSVAEHCILMSKMVPPKDALWALLHDATEAYVGDMVRPLKIHMPAYVEVEDRLMAVICQRFGLVETTMPDTVREADNRILLDERAELFAGTPAKWAVDGLEPLGVTVMGLRSRIVEELYLARLDELIREVAA